ncbi:MAG: Na+/H+ antiporter [uncultured Solirubrobacterales bacterium]|uniref:Na+/H+ antiporter n=1 Tax=uncultured Solirubrobacterales bacterium TaxID=768556 RepID=A0A6J4RR13_9ACTN|nr:MAG: Na+/H+ antiporter [uncultured Solirubrobacterales bacterium]
MQATDSELVLLVLLAGAVALIVLAYRTRVPYPILLVIGGLGLGLAPGLPNVALAPELVLLIFLPPLLYSAAFFSSLRDLRANVGPISLLSVGLVLVTTVTVAVVAHELVGLPWPAAFVLGAIVSPTDPVAATTIARRLGAPRRVVTIVEGESLINDGTALVAYRFAVAAAVTGSFSAWQAGLEFVLSVGGGAAVGLAVGWTVAQLRRRLEDPLTEITISLATAYFAYLPAELLGTSGVIAAVSAGVYLGWRSPELISPGTRLQAFAVWEVVTFVLNGALFILIGLQLPVVLDGLAGQRLGGLLLDAALVSAAVILTRFAWVYPATWLPRRLSARRRMRDPMPPLSHVFLVAWTGMRGGVALAAALALPLETASGAAFPARDTIVFLAFAVILVTLLLEGLTLPAIIRRLGLSGAEAEDWRESEARLRAAEAALERIDELAPEDWVRDDTAERMRGLYEYRRKRFQARFDEGDGHVEYEERSADYQRLRRELLEAERASIVDLRQKGVIDEETMRRVERDLDLEDTRLEA